MVRDGGDVDVCIIGGGPVGLFAANILGKCGVQVHVFERTPEVYWAARAVSMSHDIIRLHRNAGESLMNKVADHVLNPRALIFNGHPHKTSTQSLLYHTDEYRTFVKDKNMFYYDDFQTFHQPTVEEYWRSNAFQCSSVTMNVGCEMQNIKGGHGDERNTVLVKMADGVETEFRCKYLFGADGGRSAVRKMLGIEFSGNTYKDQPVVRLPGSWYFRFELLLNPGETSEEMLKPEKVNELLVLSGIKAEDLDQVQVVRNITYTFHARIADKWKVGNAFIGGDAAHCQPPFQGQGMCSGLRDAANLSWKLDWVLKGKASSSILNTYHSERLDNQKHVIAQTIELGHFLMMRSWILSFFRDTVCIWVQKIMGATWFCQNFIPLPKIFIKDGVLSEISEKRNAVTGHLMPCPVLTILRHPEIPKSDVTACLDDTIDTRNMTFFWMTSSSKDPELATSLSAENLEYLKMLECRIVVIRLTTDDRGEAEGADVTARVSYR
eukprot:gene2173-2881_t